MNSVIDRHMGQGLEGSRIQELLSLPRRVGCTIFQADECVHQHRRSQHSTV